MGRTGQSRRSSSSGSGTKPGVTSQAEEAGAGAFDPSEQMTEPSDQLNVPSDKLVEASDGVAPCRSERAGSGDPLQPDA